MPYGITNVPWRLGQCLAWNGTVVELNVENSADTAASAVYAKVYIHHRTKYTGQLPVDIEFVPLAFETLGGWGPSAASFVGELGKRLIEVTGDTRAKDFLLQRLSVAILNGNAASVMGSVLEEVVEDDNVYLDSIAY